MGGQKYLHHCSLLAIASCVGSSYISPAYAQSTTADLNRASLLAIISGGVYLSSPAAAFQQEKPNNLPLGKGVKSRQISFSVPLVFNQRVLGDVLIEIEPGAPTSFETTSLRVQLASLLNEKGIEALDQTIASRAYIGSDELASAGFEIRFDENRLEVVVESISGEYRPVSSLGREEYQSARDSLTAIKPAGFSTYLNFNTNLDYSSQDNFRNPEVFVSGAARYDDIVVELDGAVSDQFGGSYRFYRRSVRAIYDQPEKFRRFTAGDLRLPTIPLLQTPFIGGIAVEKRRQIFNPFQAVSRLGGQEIFLDSRSTVNVLVNGAQYQTFQLDAGRYDLANLPLQAGSNNVELRIRDSGGREQTINLDYFFEPLNLSAGEEEYAFSAGFIAKDLNFEPDYTKDPVAIGYYRRALSENFILGGAFQLSEEVQTFAAEATIVPQVIPGAFDVQVAASSGNGTGVAARASYRLRSGNSFANRKQFNFTIDYESSNYRTVGEVFVTNFNLLNLTASYTQGFSERTFASAGATYTRRGGGQTDRSQVFLDVVHRLNDRMRLTGGIEYGDDGFSSNKFGARVGLVVLFGGRNRANVDYRSRTATTRAAFSRGSDNSVGSFGYDVGFNDSRGSTSVDASADYVGNRFDARASFFSDGGDFGSITDDQRVRLQVGTAIAFADGAFGVGRPISDSFALVTPHSSLKDRKVISGRNLSNNEYYARSGILGGAVQSDLSSYSSQDVQFDVDGLDPGYDIGDGLVRVDPPFRSGYKIVVGNDRFVSTLGTLKFGSEPAALVSGTITSTDDEGFETLPFFTNSAGRFGAIGLAPGKTYLVSIPSSGRSFTIEVPSDNTGLYRLGEVKLPAESE
jgi:outer membrane usher protein